MTENIQLAALEERLTALEWGMEELTHNVIWEVAETGTDNIGAWMADLFLAAKMLRYQQMIVDIIEALSDRQIWHVSTLISRPVEDIDTAGRT